MNHTPIASVLRLTALACGVVAAAATTACLTPAGRLERAPAVDARHNDDGIRFVDVGDAWLRVRVRGPDSSPKVPLVLVHGFGARLDNWRAVQDALAVDRLVVAFDLKGFGQSERSDGAYGPDKHGHDVLAVMDAVGIDAAVLAGHSYGGGVIMRTAIEAPERVLGLALVDALILEAQVPTSFRWAKAPVLGEAIFSVLFSELPGEKYVMAFHDGQRFATAKVLDEVHAMQSQPGSTFAQLETVRAMGYADAETHYGVISKGLPRVVVWGEKDRVTPLRYGKLVAAAVDAPLIVLPAVGHVGLIERPTPVIVAIAEVLRQADAAARHVGRAPPAHRPTPTPAIDTLPAAANGDDDDDATDMPAAARTKETP